MLKEKNMVQSKRIRSFFDERKTHLIISSSVSRCTAKISIIFTKGNFCQYSYAQRDPFEINFVTSADSQKRTKFAAERQYCSDRIF